MQLEINLKIESMKQKITDNPISKMRPNYTRDGLLEEDVAKNAIEQFSTWFTETKTSKILGAQCD